MSDPNDDQIFDEESCLYFLREVGIRVVPFYPFDFGMEEVYSLILERYGFDGLPDVTSVLQDLLEGDNTATGVGDDGDIWRSWRHSWRHRNDNPSAPFIPKIGKFVLQNPTPVEVRRVRALRFLAREAEFLLHEHPESSPSASSGISKSPHTPNGRVDSDSAVWVPTSSAPRKSVSHQRHRTKLSIEGGHIKTNRNDPHNNTPRLSSSQETVAQGPGTGTTISIPAFGVGDHVDHRKNPEQNPYKAGDRSAGMVHPQSSAAVVHDQNAHEIDIVRENTPDEPVKDLKTLTPSPGALRKRRNTHRRATLIDGALFIQQNVEEGSSPASKIHERHSWFSRDPKPPSRYSVSAVRQNLSTNKTRQSWVKSLLSILPPITRKKRVRTSQDINNADSPSREVSEMDLQNSQNSRISSPDIFQSRPPYFGLDGASDQFRSRPASPVQLNKALPPNPDDIVRSMSVRARSPSFQTITCSNFEPSTASTNNSAITQKSYQKAFSDLTQQLMNENMLERHALPPVREVSNQTVVRRADPPKSPAVHPSPLFFANFAQQNPFTDDPVPLTPINAPPPHLQNTKRERQSRSPRMTTSRSEPALQPLGDNNILNRTNLSTFQGEDALASQSIDRNNARTNEGRGRVQERPNIGNSVDQVANFRVAYAKSPSKRSRSPVKRLFDMVKKPESRDIVEDGSPVHQLGRNEGGLKISIKSWSNKLRTGFQAAEQEQSALEALMEGKDEQIIQALSKPAAPVSLDPPFQAKIQSELELMLATTVNKFLLDEANASRLSLQSIIQTRERWTAKHRPEILEFLYDQTTQRDLILQNIKTVVFHGPCARDILAVRTVIHGWGVMAKEMSIRTFSTNDDTFRKHLHETYRVLEMFGASSVTMLAFQELQIKILSRISDFQRRHLKHKSSGINHQRSVSDSSQNVPYHRNISGTSYKEYCRETGQQPQMPHHQSTTLPHAKTRKPTGATGAVMGTGTPPLRSSRWA